MTFSSNLRVSGIVECRIETDYLLLCSDLPILFFDILSLFSLRNWLLDVECLYYFQMHYLLKKMTQKEIKNRNMFENN